MNHFSIRLWCMMKNRFYTTTGSDRLSGWAKKELQSTSQSQTCTKKRSWSLFGGLLPIWSTTAVWIPGKPLYLRSILSKSMRCTENCNTCSLALVNRMDPILSHDNAQPHIPQPMLQKLTESGYEDLPYLPYSPDLLANWLPHFQASLEFFAGKNGSKTSRRQKMLSKSSWSPEVWMFML